MAGDAGHAAGGGEPADGVVGREAGGRDDHVVQLLGVGDALEHPLEHRPAASGSSTLPGSRVEPTRAWMTPTIFGGPFKAPFRTWALCVATDPF